MSAAKPWPGSGARYDKQPPIAPPVDYDYLDEPVALDTQLPMTQGQIVAVAARVRVKLDELKRLGLTPVGVVVSTQRNGISEMFGLPVSHNFRLGWTDIRIEVEA